MTVNDVEELREPSEGGSCDLSLVVPCYNEEGNVVPFMRACAETFDPEDISYEVVFVNDGSSDATMDRLKQLLVDDDGAHAIQVIGFSRNFGKESAIYAGMKAAQGDTICLIDADLQQDPKLALKMYRYLAAHDDCDVVAAYQERRREGALRGWVKRMFYKSFNAASDGVKLPENMSDFRVFRRSVADALLEMPEYYRFSKGLFAWVGFNTHAVPYTPKDRLSGTTDWSTRKLIKYAVTGMTAFTTWPLKVAKWVGLVCFIASFLYLLYVVFVDYLIIGTGVPGYATLVSLVLMFGGLQLFVLGIMGDYQARSYIEEKRRPLYIVRDRYRSQPDAEQAGQDDSREARP